MPLVTTRASRNSANYELVLEREDSNSIKLNLSVATSETDTFLIFPNGSVSDMLGNPIVGLTTGIAPVMFIPDTTGPSLESYNLGYGLGILNLNFSEPIDTSTVLVTAFTQQNLSNGITHDSFQLTSGSTVVGPSDDMITIRIGVLRSEHHQEC